ncbi:hypothetical protein Clacol_007307 [Clathrus columnatus]|uniref:NACHT domain-containing protein n=1 Tax=Clathrus columnatus TaxID=1419009 RepID=A0AAV5AIV7_9AGAM|nr:hypothetical protein Clacol_007307 [Clathrus columnatus]
MALVNRQSFSEQIIYAEITAVVVRTKLSRPSRRLKVILDDTKETMINITYDPQSHEEVLQGISALGNTLNAIANPPDILSACASILNILSHAHPIAQAAAMIVSLPYTLLKNESDFNDKIRQLGNQIRNLLPHLKDISLIMTSESLRNIVIEIIRLIIQITRFIGEYLKKTYLGRNAQILFANSPLDDYLSKLTGLDKDLGRAIQIQTAQLVQKIDTRHLMEGLRKRLKPVELAELDDGFLEGTRIKIMERIKQWIHASDSKNIFYIYGSPGAGKSSIASRIVTTLMPEEVRIRFFFKRDLDSLREPKLIWRTVAWQLADLYDEYRLYLDTFLNDKGRTAYFEDSNLSQQFQDLVMTPLQDLKDSFRNYPRFLIDAIDECDPKKKKDRRLFLDCLEKWQSLPSVFKLIITSRDETDIHKAMEDISDSIGLLTGEEADEDSIHDVQIFLRKGFNDIEIQPGESDIEKLTAYASGLFIWAKTVIDFVEEESPMQRLAEVLSNIRSVSLHEGTNGKINALYGQILYSIVKPLTETERNAYEIILGSILFAKEPLRPSALEKLLHSIDGLQPSIKSVDIRFSLRKFRTILRVSDTDDPLRVRHVSFGDFYFSGPDRIRKAIAAYAKVREAEAPSFSFMLPIEHDANLMVASLRAMNNSLEFNICKFPSSYQMNKEVPRLCDQIPPALIYSSLHWAEHMQIAIAAKANILLDISEFLHEHFLHWLEVLSAVEAVSSGAASLLIAARTLESIGETDLGYYCRDASRFIVTFREPISESIPHIYISSLPFAPDDSPVAKTYRPKFRNTLSLIAGRMSRWPRVLQVVVGHKATISSIIFSPDGKWIVSGSHDETIRIWDANTGQVVRESLQGHTGAVTGVAMSRDGKCIASSAEDNHIIIWDVITNKPLLDPLHGHEEVVTTVAFSPCGQVLISGSRDKTLRMWERATGQCIKVITGHTDHVMAIAFSPDGAQFVSCSRDKTVRVWDFATGIGLWDLRGHKSSVSCVVISPDGKYIASGSDDKSIRIWNSTTGECVVEHIHGHVSGLTCLAYSPDGRYIISGSLDETIRIWDATTGYSLSDPLQGHSSPISSVAFSRDGKYFVSGAHDGTIQLWDAFTSQNQFSVSSLDRCSSAPRASSALLGEWDPIEPVDYIEESVVSLSPDGKYIISSSGDGSISIRDAATGQTLPDTQVRGHTVSVLPVSFAVDGLRVVSLRTRQIFNIDDPVLNEKPLALLLFPDTGKISLKTKDQSY